MKVSEIFESIQGEGRYAGTPTLFIRTSGCNLKCGWCDTSYHKNGKDFTVKQVANNIKKSKKRVVVWTGGEPCLQMNEILETIALTNNLSHHLETNGTIVENHFFVAFDYVCFSPKNYLDCKKLVDQLNTKLVNFDIKIVTDLKKIGVEMLSHATMLMPLTTYDKKKDLQIKKNVWDYCIKHNLKCSPRLQVDLFGKKKGV